MITNTRLFHGKKMHTTSIVLPAPMTWLVFTLLLASVAAAVETTAKVITTPVFAQIPRLQASKDFQVLVRVEAPQQQRRVPVDLAVVLDVGGGGATGLARLDAVKKAVKFIVRQIHDDDRLAVVGPSAYRLVTGFLSTRDARRNAEKSIDELEARGDRDEFASGAAAAGLEEAIKILEDLPATASRSIRARFVILVTDTAVTEDSGGRFSKLPRELLPPVHTFGLGAAHDPRPLHSIARKSQGTYSFVEDENTGGITGAIAVCLGGLKDVVAVGTRVRVETPVGSGVTIERIESGGYASPPIIRDKASGEVAVGVLYATEVKTFLVHLSVPALPSTLSTTTTVVDGGCDKQQLLTASFVGRYTTRDEEDAAAPSPTVTQAILYVQRPPPEAIDGTLQRVPVPVVMNHIARFGVLEMVTTFVNKDIWLLNSITVEVATKLRNQWEQFVQARQFWSGLDLGVLDVEVNRMVSILEEAAGRGTRSGSSTTTSLSSATAYMLSWLSSYQMQRPTAMGSPSSIAAAFVTVNMQLTLQQATIITTAAHPLCIDGGCPACECECEVRCVQPLPPPVLVPSGRGDDTYRVHPAYPQDALFNAINQAMKQMYLALVQASNLTRCDAAAGDLEVLPA